MINLPQITKPVIIIGGGPSLKEIDVSKIDTDKYFIMGLNFAYKLMHCDHIHFSDLPFYIMAARDLVKLENTTLSSTGHLDWEDMHIAYGYWDKAGVKYYMNLTRDEGIDMDPAHEDYICGNNSGHQAINVAARLGAKEIYLLGYDMSTGKNNESEWHNEAPCEKSAMDVQIERWLRKFRTTVEPLEKAGIKVYNCNPESALDCFPKIGPDILYRK